HFGFGDVSGFDSKLIGPGIVGRGAVVTNRPLFTTSGFDRSHFEGDLPAGWEAELYRNGELLAFSPTSTDQRYHFDDVQLLYGENRIEILLYGPQGQVRSRVETLDVADAAAPPGKTWYWAGVNQPGRDLVMLAGQGRPSTVPKLQATAAVEHGLDARTSIGLNATMQQLDDERLTYVEGTVRRSVGRALVEVSGVRDSRGGTAARVGLLARLGSVNISGQALVASNFRLEGVRERSIRQAELALDAPLHLGRTLIPAHASLRVVDRADQSREIDAAARLSANINRFNLATDLRYRHLTTPYGPAPPDTLAASLIGAGHIGHVRLRGTTTFDLLPSARFALADVSAYWSASERADWEAGVGYDGFAKRARARISHIRRFNSMAVALTGEAASDGSVAVGFNLLFSLDPTRGFRPSRQPMASAGLVRAHVYRDLNDNGAQDAGEPDEPRALITTGTHVATEETDRHGRALIAGLALYRPIAVGIDESSLPDPMLTPRKALQVVTPRAGVAADIEIGLVGAGSVEGLLVKSGGGGFEGIDLELLDGSGKVVATARTDYDGYFLFDRVAYGRYGVCLAAASANAIHSAVAIDAKVVVSGERPTVRLGSLRPNVLPQVAGIEPQTSRGDH
ncbi:MAG: carboxypeptidase regulatory-like domain-containing protein, partial [Sphingomonadales bacterium]|nr:carboxypeptidase regulatory-like domain-containing protein [Sphingomonadales bacterium]